MTFQNIFSNKKLKEEKKQVIIADNREKNSLVISELINLGNKVELKQLDIADYIVNNIAIERKTMSDLISSIIDKRIFSQLNNLKQYPEYLLILEQNNNAVSNINENAIKGFLLSVALKFKVPIIYTLNEKDTAKYISLIANKKKDSPSSIRPNKKPQTKEEQIQFILEGFPKIGPAKAKELIKEFKTLRNIANSKVDSLEKVIGKEGKEIYDLFNLEYAL